MNEGEVSFETALTLIRELPGEARVLPQVMGEGNGLLFQFESGIQISWHAGAFHLTASESLRQAWQAVKADR